MKRLLQYVVQLDLVFALVSLKHIRLHPLKKQTNNSAFKVTVCCERRHKPTDPKSSPMMMSPSSSFGFYWMKSISIKLPPSVGLSPASAVPAIARLCRCKVKTFLRLSELQLTKFLQVINKELCVKGARVSRERFQCQIFVCLTFREA